MEGFFSMENEKSKSSAGEVRRNQGWINYIKIARNN